MPAISGTPPCLTRGEWIAALTTWGSSRYGDIMVLLSGQLGISLETPHALWTGCTTSTNATPLTAPLSAEAPLALLRRSTSVTVCSASLQPISRWSCRSRIGNHDASPSDPCVHECLATLHSCGLEAI